ncbi:hypothetical protein BMS3Abin03_01585 [bacterium BMS3Abin03]|nr:hypothetical protein BMS3Abin03_01585 [bacterium BMS3Abin03]
MSRTVSPSIGESKSDWVKVSTSTSVQVEPNNSFVEDENTSIQIRYSPLGSEPIRSNVLFTASEFFDKLTGFTSKEEIFSTPCDKRKTELVPSTSSSLLSTSSIVPYK